MKKLAYRLLYSLGLVRLAAWWNRRRVMILCYHGVTERAARSPLDRFGLHVRRDRFAEHLEYLRQHHHVLSLTDYLKARREKSPLPDYSVVLTFDDGYRNFLTAAAPRLASSKMPASVFIITDRVRSDGKQLGPDWSETDDETYLSWEEAQRLIKEQAIEFGSHTCSHRQLSELSPDEAERELQASLDIITAHLGNGAFSLAYPYGAYSDAIIEKAHSLRYACALTTDAGANDLQSGLFALRRTLIGDDDDKASFAVRVSGLAWWLSRALSPLQSQRSVASPSLRPKRSEPGFD